MRTGTFAAMTLGDAMSIQPSVSSAEIAARKAVERRTVLGSLDDAIDRDREEEAALSGEGEQ